MSLRPMFAGFLPLLLSTAAFAGESSLPDPDHYWTEAQTSLRERIEQPKREKRAKNVILFIGDGMGISTLTAGRIYEGQKAGSDGESHDTEIDMLPFGGLVKTYTHDAQVADSAGTATAIVTGYKTRNGVLGISGTAPRGDCRAALDNPLSTLFEQAEVEGLATGIVTTTRITHATPAAAFAHSADRDWEADSDLPADAKKAGCIDIARQLVEWPAGDGFEVVLGGGRENFLPTGKSDPEYAGKTGRRTDKRDLIREWQKRNKQGIYAWNSGTLADAQKIPGVALLGLFEPSHMQYELDRAKDAGGEPSLAEMTRIAIERLEQNKTGYVLMIEGGRIDHAHHAGNAARAFGDMRALDEAIKVARSMTSQDDTLIIATADHSHTLTISGYPERGNPILGVMRSVGGEEALGKDGKPYTTLGYINGPGAVPPGERPDPSAQNSEDEDYRQQSLVPLDAETHGGEDVAIKASGPWAHLFTGTMEQNLIYHVMRHALGF